MSNQHIILGLMITLIITILFFVGVLIVYQKKRKEQYEDAVFLHKNKAIKPSIYQTAYDFFSDWPFTRRYISKLRRQFEILRPEDGKQLEQKVIKIAVEIWILELGIFIMILLTGSPIYTVLTTVAFLFVLDRQIITIMLEREEGKLLRQLGGFLGEVRHNFYAHGMVEEAIYDSLEQADYEVELHGNKIYEILISKDIDEEVALYNDQVPNRFLKTFLALCVSLLQFGDKEVEGKSLFLSNLNNLKQEIYIEILKRERINYLFSGLVFIALLPIFFLKPIQQWGISNLPELEAYYKGAFGIITATVIFVITLMSYALIDQLREISIVDLKDNYLLEYIVGVRLINQLLDNYINKNYGKTLVLSELLKKVGEPLSSKQFILKRCLYMFIFFMGTIILSIGIHMNNRYQAVNNVKNLVNLTSFASPAQSINIQTAVKTYTNKYKHKKVTSKQLKQELYAQGTIKNKQLIELTSKEIQKRINIYQKEYYKWFELLVALAVGVLGYKIPLWILYYRKKVMQMGMEDEVIQFQSIILMLIHMDRMTVENILEWIYNFSIIFQMSIQECLNNFSTGDLLALEELKEKEPFEPFQRIVENLQICDKIGIEKAFDELAMDRLQYQEKRKQENDIYINNKAIIGKVIAYIPMILTMGLYLIIPFLVESLSQLLEFMKQLEI